MSEMIKRGYRITFDSDNENAFIVHCGGGKQMRFVNRKGIYIYEDPNDIGNEAAYTSLRARDNVALNVNNHHFLTFTRRM